MTVDAAHWAGCSDTERADIAEDIAQRTGARLLDIDEQQIARFSLAGREVVLVPGGEQDIGFSPAVWSPLRHERESWKATADAYGLSGTIEEHVDRVTTAPRQVTVPPMLVATRAEEPLSGEATTRHTHASLLDALAHSGQRLPTSDEWEYLCSGGARTLFRWGDRTEASRYPVDVRAGSGHRRPNRLGLTIAEDPYHTEVVMEPTHLRGGDGGSAICGGVGFFLGWLPLASAYFEPYVSTMPAGGVLMAGFSSARPVLPL